MILVNEEPLDWHEGMTVRDILRARNYRFPMLVIHVNDVLVHKRDYDATTVPDGAVVAGVLGILDGVRLTQLARDLNVALPQDAGKPKVVASIAQASPELEQLLPRLTRDELRAACRAHKLDHRGPHCVATVP